MEQGQGACGGWQRRASSQALSRGDTTLRACDPHPQTPCRTGGTGASASEWCTLSSSPNLRAQRPAPLPLSPQPAPCACRPRSWTVCKLGCPELKWGRKAVPRGRAGQSPSHLRKGGSGRGGRGASSSSPGLAVLYGFLFLCDSTAHSYRDWSRGARRGRPAEGPRRAGTAATFPQRRRLAWPRGPSCCFPPHGWRGLKDPLTALTHHPRLTPIPRLGPGMGLSSQRSG